MFALALLLGLSVSGAAEAGCLSGGQARSVVASGAVMGPGQIVAGLARQAGVRVMDAVLCERGGAYVYQLTILTGAGTVRNIVVDAQSGTLLAGSLNQ